MKTTILFFVCVLNVFGTHLFAQVSTPLTSDFIPPRGNAPTSPSESPGYFRLITATSADSLTFTGTGQIVSDQANVADMVMDAKGRIYLYFTGWTVGNQQNVTAVALSDDQGKTWFFKYVRFTGLPNAMSKPADPDIILLPDGTFRMYATTNIGTDAKLGIIYAESSDGITFQYKGTSAALANNDALIDSNTFLLGDTWYMYAIGTTATTHYRFTSKDGKTFSAAGELRLTTPGVMGEYFASNGYTTSDGRYRMFASFLPEKNLRSFITSDGTNWTLESGNRMTFTGVQPEELYLKDPAVLRLSNGSYLAVVTTRLTQSATVFAPRITAISPLSGSAGATITITGENFTGASAVLIGGIPATSFIVLSPTQIRAVAPVGASGGIAVQTPVGSATSTSAFMTTSTRVANAGEGTFSIAPNPASNLAIAHFSLQMSQHVSLKVFNILGQEIATILDETLPVGEHRKALVMSDWSLGNQILFVQLKTQHSTLTTIPIQVLR